jgi:hypothetical protein
MVVLATRWRCSHNAMLFPRRLCVNLGIGLGCRNTAQDYACYVLCRVVSHECGAAVGFSVQLRYVCCAGGEWRTWLWSLQLKALAQVPTAQQELY